MEKINRIVYDAASNKDAAEAYEQLRKIWDIPPWNTLMEGRKGNYEPLYHFLEKWDGKASPFKGPSISFPTHVGNERYFGKNVAKVNANKIGVITDVSKRRIEITLKRHPTIEIGFGDEGSVFAAGDVLARLLKIARTTQYRAQVLSELTDGSDREPDFPIFQGMAHEWSLAQRWNTGRLNEAELLEELEKLAAMEVP